MGAVKRVEVIWEDVATQPGWCDPDEDMESLICTQVGYVCSQDDSYLVVVSSFTNDGDVGDKTKIPMSLVRSLREI